MGFKYEDPGGVRRAAVAGSPMIFLE